MYQKQDLDNKKILITGASGFVGAVLLRRLVNDYTRSKPYILLRSSSNTWRIKDILKKVNIVGVDITEGEKLKKELNKIKPDIVFHLAAYGAYPSQNKLGQAVKSNIVGTTNLLLALENVNYTLFVNTGSSSEYGYKNQPMKESDQLEPASYYAASKASATHICTAHGILNNRPIITLRLFSIYGPYEEPGRFVPTAVLSAIRGKDIEVVGGPKRDFVYVEDVVDAYLACLKLNIFNQRILNICSGTQTSIEDTAKMIVKLAKSKSKVRLGKYKPRPWDTNYWVGDGKLTKKVLKWVPRNTLSKGLIESIKWFKSNSYLYDEK